MRHEEEMCDEGTSRSSLANTYCGLTTASVPHANVFFLTLGQHEQNTGWLEHHTFGLCVCAEHQTGKCACRETFLR